MSTNSTKAHPFAGLLGVQLARIPASGSATTVVDGKRVTDLRQVPKEDLEEGEEDRRERLRLELQQARDRARYQRARQNPAEMAKRKAWYEANREKVLAYKRDYDKRNHDRIVAQQREWALRKYHADPEAAREKQRAYYARNREKILAKLKAQRDAAKAEREQAQAQAQTRAQGGQR